MSRFFQNSGMKISKQHNVEYNRALARGRGIRICKELFDKDTIVVLPTLEAQLPKGAQFITSVPYGENGRQLGGFRFYYYQAVFLRG